jgi:ABC-type molybdenum transport system ATPase subunit/photorepair protein PhrA
MNHLREKENDETTIVFDLQGEQADICDGKWMQARYYCDDGDRVRDFLSFNSVFEVNPFEIGVNRRAARKAHRVKLQEVVEALELTRLLPQNFLSLSNGEMRRVLFARAILKNPEELVLVSPMAGLDIAHRAMFQGVIDMLMNQGVDISIVGDEESLNPIEAVKNKERDCDRKPVVEMRDITVRFGRRTLFENLSWTIREGERWLLCGPNGSGKTTLLAFMTGDSPLAYAYDIRLFGVPRAIGNNLSKVRRRIAMVSPEMQAYLGLTPEALLDQALEKEPDLLLLDEPCYSLTAKTAEKVVARVERWVKKRPSATVVCVAHSASHVPAGFDHILDLGRRTLCPDKRCGMYAAGKGRGCGCAAKT